jgi:2-C-methyl-D-erythritol 4-phosphate cytidylyltransferase
MADFAVIIPAAGASTRFEGKRNKLLEDLGGRPVIARTLAAFLGRHDVAQIVVPTTLEDEIRPMIRDGEDEARLCYCGGGPSRAESVLNALRRVDSAIEWVAVHDGARPLVSDRLIDRTLAAAVEHGAAVPALAVSLTIKQARGPLPARVERTVPREALWAMQTPQIMRRSDLLAAFEACPIPLAQVTDDVQLIELAGKGVWLVEGEERNLKITTAMDLKIARMWVAEGA